MLSWRLPNYKNLSIFLYSVWVSKCFDDVFLRNHHFNILLCPKMLIFSSQKEKKWFIFENFIILLPIFFHPHVLYIIEHNSMKFDISSFTHCQMACFSSSYRQIWAVLEVGSCLVRSALQKTSSKHFKTCMYYRKMLKFLKFDSLQLSTFHFP